MRICVQVNRNLLIGAETGFSSELNLHIVCYLCHQSVVNSSLMENYFWVSTLVGLRVGGVYEVYFRSFLVIASSCGAPRY